VIARLLDSPANARRGEAQPPIQAPRVAAGEAREIG